MTAQWPFGDLPRGRYGTLYADPPWQWRAYSSKGEGRSACQHYGIMSFSDLCALPIADLAAPNCALFLWALDSMQPEAQELIRQWGFRIKTTAFTWVKTNAKSPGFFMGCGYWTRCNPEVCLLATRGKPRRLARDVRQLVVSPRREHSRKPDVVREYVERLVAGPYLELFARTTHPGWDCWGNETQKFTGAA